MRLSQNMVAASLLAVGLGFALADEGSGLRAWIHLREELAEAGERRARLEREIERLRAERDALDRDPFALERAIREDLDLAQPGETVVRFPAPAPVEGGLNGRLEARPPAGPGRARGPSGR
ncbi:MAG: septum formation initiator family protein [Proteobacteria bacterium]|nr:septum formation initiator family protein [Pseudomonadota bacterium]